MSAAIAFAGRRRRVFDGLVRLSGAKPGDQVLDVGCGTGYFTRRVVPAILPDGQATGIDASATVIDYANRTAPPGCTFLLASAENLPLPEASVDLVISSFAMHHLRPELRGTALREMRRVLRPDGRLFIADFRPPRNRVAGHLVGALGGHAMQHNPVHQLADLIAQSGFQVMDTGDRRPLLHYLRAERGKS
ncbi:methyltransferase domain-containing protein [Plantactinospora sp. ZYX-F-223]|uniref:class I SAM-dependent methyltransferase n=1 Tax=Plantactinospora sp. ZYX-F-223 TaxID=3144103 RepID=UPI0031FC3348